LKAEDFEPPIAGEPVLWFENNIQIIAISEAGI